MRLNRYDEDDIYEEPDKELLKTRTRENEVWKSIERKDLEYGRYKISTNGRVRDNQLNIILPTFIEGKSKHKLVKLQRIDNSYTIGNVTALMILTFVTRKISSYTEYYFINGDDDDLFVHNIGICLTSISSLTDNDIHNICKMMESNVNYDIICKRYPQIARRALMRFIVYIANGKTRRDISSKYQI